jgi:hypothetical protein
MEWAMPREKHREPELPAFARSITPVFVLVGFLIRTD